MTAIDPFADVRLPTTTTPPAREPGDQFGKDTFLKLLVAQLRFQNPLAPTDGTEFLAQTAQFTMVEKLIEIEKQAKESALANEMLTATTMIGRSVTFRLGAGDVPEPVATTKASLAGTLSASAQPGAKVETTAEVFTNAGEKVPLRVQFTRRGSVADGSEWELRVFAGGYQVGQPQLVRFDAQGEPLTSEVKIAPAYLDGIAGTRGSWSPDGLTFTLGSATDAARVRVADGSSRVSMREHDGSDGTTSTGIVSGVRVDPTGGTLLRIGEREVPLTSVTEVDVPNS